MNTIVMTIVMTIVIVTVTFDPDCIVTVIVTR